MLGRSSRSIGTASFQRSHFLTVVLYSAFVPYDGVRDARYRSTACLNVVGMSLLRLRQSLPAGPIPGREFASCGRQRHPTPRKSGPQGSQNHVSCGYGPSKSLPMRHPGQKREAADVTERSCAGQKRIATEM